MSTTNTRDGPKSLRCHCRHQANWPGADHATTSPGLISARSAPKKAGGKDVTDEDGLLVTHAVGDELHRVIRERHHDVLRLAPPRFPKYSPWPKVDLSTHWLKPTLPAEGAHTAGREEAGYDAIAPA